jgi:peptide deformylase
MVRVILKYGAPELERESSEVTEFNDDLKQLAEDMLETMYAAPGVGLAAPQVGVNLRLIVVDPTAGEQQGHQTVLVNPEVLDQKGRQKEEEGCLSFPGITTSVDRPEFVLVKGQDLEGNVVELEVEGLEARAICHEIDHLDGVLFIDRVSRLKRDMIKRKIRKLVKAGDW